MKKMVILRRGIIGKEQKTVKIIQIVSLFLFLKFLIELLGMECIYIILVLGLKLGTKQMFSWRELLFW